MPPTLPRRRWADMSTREFAALDGAHVIAVLPVAAIEQHGPHLPVSVDRDINDGLIARMLDRLPEALPVTVLPTLPVGKSVEHLAYPGTLTLSAETLTALWLEVGASVARAGVRKLVIVNTHGGQPQVVDIVVRELRIRHGMFAVGIGPSGFAAPEGLFSDHELRHGIHGGETETSAMLALRPDLVQMEHAGDFVPVSVAMERDFELLRPEGGIGFGWMTQDVHPSGAVGNAAAADAARGAALLDAMAGRLVRLLAEVDRFDLALLSNTPDHPCP